MNITKLKQRFQEFDTEGKWLFQVASNSVQW